MGTDECFQSTGDRVLYLGLDVSVFFELSINDLPGVCGHVHVMKTWVTNYKVSLNRKKSSEKDTDPKDKDQE